MFKSPLQEIIYLLIIPVFAEVNSVSLWEENKMSSNCLRKKNRRKLEFLKPEWMRDIFLIPELLDSAEYKAHASCDLWNHYFFLKYLIYEIANLILGQIDRNLSITESQVQQRGLCINFIKKKNKFK